MPINADLLNILACPKCRGNMIPTSEQEGLICNSCNLVYEIRDDIPNLIIEGAKPLSSG